MNFLSKNIRYLRKTRKWSQEELAHQLGVKRSSIAAYECKNVRPRLKFIVELGKLFRISVSHLIEEDIERKGGLEKFIPGENGEPKTPNSVIGGITLTGNGETDVEEFVEKSIRIRKMLEGFKVFYQFKLEQFQDLDPEAKKLTADIENFLLLMEHLLAHNEAVIRAISDKQAPDNHQKSNRKNNNGVDSK